MPFINGDSRLGIETTVVEGFRAFGVVDADQQVEMVGHDHKVFDFHIGKVFRGMFDACLEISSEGGVTHGSFFYFSEVMAHFLGATGYKE